MKADKRSLILAAMLASLVTCFSGGASAQSDDEFIASQNSDQQWQVIAHDFTVAGFDYRVYVKLNRHTGQTWRFHAFNLKWIEVGEPQPTHLPIYAERHYEMFAHDTVINGEPVEFLIRVDRVTGDTWIYNGNYPAWKMIPKEG